MGKNPKEEQKSALCEEAGWTARSAHSSHWSATKGCGKTERTRGQESTLSYPGLQSSSSGNDKAHSSEANVRLHGFHRRLSHQQRDENTHAFIHSVHLGGLPARLVLRIWGCLSKSARFLCAPLSPKMPSRLWMAGLSLGKAKPPPWLGRVQTKMSKHYEINQETMKATSQNYQTQPSWHALLQSKSCSYLGLRPGHCPHTWAAGKIRAVLRVS